jgi:hypothetical protein
MLVAEGLIHYTESKIKTATTSSRGDVGRSVRGSALSV